MNWAGYCVFSLIHRCFYWPISELTLVNVTYTLCTTHTDPMYRIFGDWYLLAAELYLGGSSFVFRYVYLGLFYAIHWFLDPWIVKRKSSVTDKEK